MCQDRGDGAEGDDEIWRLRPIEETLPKIASAIKIQVVKSV